jgi:hypothetical protein
MARYYSNHQISKMDKKLNENDLLNTQKYKQELKTALNQEYHRINVDSAKKKAVLQRMDYDGFHQMVLGADLKGIKKDEITNILAKKETIMNSSLTGRKLGEEVDVLSKNFVPFGKEDGNNLIPINDDYIDLKKFSRKWKSLCNVNDKISFLNESSNRFEELTNSDVIEADFFADFINTMCSFLDNNLDEENLMILHRFIDNKQCANLKKFLGKKVKTNYSNLYDKYKDNEILEKIIDRINN